MDLKKTLSWLSLIVTFSSFPYIGNYLFGPFYILISSGLIILLSAVVFSLYLKTPLGSENNEAWIKMWFAYLLAVFAYAILIFIREGTLFDLRRFFGLLFKVIFAISSSILIVKNSSFVKTYLKVNYIISFASIVLFCLLIIGLPLPSFTFTKLDGRDHEFFFIGASNVVYNWNGIRALRVAGFADEPGAFALMINYFLCINEITIKNRNYRVVFTIAGILTLSLAFYITFLFIVIYWIINKVLKIKPIIITGSILAIAAITINSIFPIEALSKLFDIFFKRFEYDSQSGKYAGDNRSESFTLQWDAFRQYFFLGLGDNLEVKRKYELYNLSFLGYMANYGLYGIFFFFMPIYAVILKYILRTEFLLILSLLVAYLQRPGIEDMFSMLSLSFLFIYSTRLNDSET